MSSITRSRIKAIIKAHLAVAIAACITHTASAETLSSPALAGQALDNPAIGEVSLVLGRAFIQAPDGSRQALSSGASVHAQDRIYTETNGHVHIRFIDQALVSIRPDSQLEIVQYDYNADQPRLSSIKLNLKEGVTRSISGRGASAARERFRLNTPIAAIGVRGTDFVVSATDKAVRAVVNEGSIVLAPYSSECTAASFGPCADNAIELSGTELQMIEFDAGTTSPRLLSAENLLGGDVLDSDMLASVINTHLPAEEKAVGTDAYLENVTSRRVEATVSESVRPQPPAAPEPQLADRQLLWGRFSGDVASVSSLSKVSIAYAEARQGRDVTVRVGDYILFRDGDGSERVQPGLGLVSFELANAQAAYHSGSGVVAMTIGSGALAINFNNNTFDTNLNMSHQLTGAVNYAASGRMDGSYFHTRSDTERMAGAVSLDGKEAGYYFDKQLEAGFVQGLTLWDKR